MAVTVERKGSKEQFVALSFAELAAHFGIPANSEETSGPILSAHGKGTSSSQVKKLQKQAVDPTAFSAFRFHFFSPEEGASKLSGGLVSRCRHLGTSYRNGSDQLPRPAIERQALEIASELVSLDRVSSLGPGVIKIDIDPAVLGTLPELPTGYGYKGGVARKLLARALKLNIETSPVRDLDLIRIGDRITDQDRMISEKYMLQDYLFCRDHGVEVHPKLSTFLSNRSFTINGLIYMNGALIVSTQCFLDTLGGVIRPYDSTFNQKREFHYSNAVRGVRLYAEGLAEGRDMQLLNWPKRNGCGNFISFYLGLHLGRALEKGEKVAELFLQKCEERGLLRGITCPRDLKSMAHYLLPEPQKYLAA